MVGLHVLHDQVVGLSALQGGGEVVQPLVGEFGIHRVHHGDLLVPDHIGVVGHAVGHHILPLEQVHLVVVYAYIQNIVGDLH